MSWDSLTILSVFQVLISSPATACIEKHGGDEGSRETDKEEEEVEEYVLPTFPGGSGLGVI